MELCSLNVIEFWLSDYLYIRDVKGVLGLCVRLGWGCFFVFEFWKSLCFFVNLIKFYTVDVKFFE